MGRTDLKSIKDLDFDSVKHSARDIVNNLPAEELPDALKWTESIPDPNSKAAFATSVLARMAAENPEAVIDYYAKLTPADMSWVMAPLLAVEIATKDPQRALEWAKTLPDPIRGQCTSAALRAWAAQDPVAAARHAESLDGSGKAK